MAEGPARTGSTTEGLPVAPSLGPGLAQAHIAPHAANVTRRTAYVCALAVAIAVLAAGVAQVLQRLIYLVTNLAFRGAASLEPLGPTTAHLGLWVILVPPIGGLVVGLMAHTGVGRLPVLSDGPNPVLVGMLTRSDLVGAHRPRLRAERVAARALARG